MMKSVVVVLATLFLATPRVVEACSCAVADVDGARRAAGSVFEGTLIRLEPANGTARATFSVLHVWKGTVQREITLSVHAQPSMCPPHFEEGQTYIIYADASNRVGACARYGAGPQLETERRALGAPVRTYRRMPPPPG